MTLLVIGDFDNKSVKAQVSQYFSDFEPFKLKKIKRKKEVKQKQPRVAVKTSEFKESLLYISWPLPSAKHKDIPAIDVMSLILGQGESSRLSKKIKLAVKTIEYLKLAFLSPNQRPLPFLNFSCFFRPCLTSNLVIQPASLGKVAPK